MLWVVGVEIVEGKVVLGHGQGPEQGQDHDPHLAGEEEEIHRTQ